MKSGLIAYLTDVELAVECEVRGIIATADNAYETLYKRLDAEQSDPNLSLLETHKIRNPRSEFQSIDEKLSEVLAYTNSTIDEIPPDNSKFIKITAQCEHYIDRLNRLGNQHSVYDKQAKALIIRWQQVESLVNPTGGTVVPSFDKAPGTKPPSTTTSNPSVTSHVDCNVPREPWTSGSWDPMVSHLPNVSTVHSKPVRSRLNRTEYVRYSGGQSDTEHDNPIGRPNRQANTVPQPFNRRPQSHGKSMHNWHLVFDGDTNKLSVLNLFFV